MYTAVVQIQNFVTHFIKAGNYMLNIIHFTSIHVNDSSNVTFRFTKTKFAYFPEEHKLQN